MLRFWNPECIYLCSDRGIYLKGLHETPHKKGQETVHPNLTP